MRDDLVALRHILDSIIYIEQYVAVGYDEYLQNKQCYDSIARRLEIIGEAAKRISEECRALAPEVKWKRVAGLRDVLIHRYWEVDEEQVWNIVDRDLPALKMAVMRLIETMGGVEN